MPISPRGKYQGVSQIVRFNWPFYVAAVAILAGGVCLTTWAPLPLWARLTFLVALASAAFWLASSLFVSHYIYDRSGLYDGAWILRAVGFAPARWANFHAGFDEFGAILQEVFPTAKGIAVDFFDPTKMTEPSIARARRLGTSSVETIRVQAAHLPFQDNELEAAFVFFSAHELREPFAREQFLAELRRVLATQGRLILLEHLRNWPNFLAFGPGFFHFHSRRTWMQAIKAAQLRVVREFSRTPFVRGFVLEKAPADV